MRTPLRSPEYIAPLTGVRALAVFLVLGHHIEANLPTKLHLALPFLKRGSLGVDLFFILSGFVITHAYWHYLHRWNVHNLKVFFWHRFIRLYPAHVTVLVFLAAIVIAGRASGYSLNHPEAWQWQGFLAQLLMIQVLDLPYAPGYEGAGWNFPSWSISAETFAYLLFPALALTFLLAKKSMSLWVEALIVFVVLVTVFVILDWLPGAIIGIPALARVSGEFLCGALLCRATALAGRPEDFLVGLVGIFALVLLIVGGCAEMNSDFTLLPPLAILVWGVAMNVGPLASLFSYFPLLWLGEISYSIYLVHMPLIWIMRPMWVYLGFGLWGDVAKLSGLITSILVIIFFASILFRLVERPARTGFRDYFGRLRKLPEPN